MILTSRFSTKFWFLSGYSFLSSLLAASLMILISGGEWEFRSAFLRPGGEPIHLRLDILSAFFCILLSIVGIAVTVYGSAYWHDRAHPKSVFTGRFWWSLFLSSLTGIFLQSNGLHFLIFWEFFSLSTYFLITLNRHSGEVRKAGWLFLAASHTGTLCLFAFFSLLSAKVGGWDLGPFPGRTDLSSLFWFAVVGFGIKAGLFPLHVWLPSAHSNAPSHVSAILSGVAIKLGIYGLIRFSGWIAVSEPAAWTIIAAGLTSAVLGVAFALGQHDLKRLLAYHSVENIGIILIGIGFAMVARIHGNMPCGVILFAGGLLHVWNHGLFKSLLFLGAGSVLHAAGTRIMSELGGLWRKMPWTAGCFLFGAAAISGLPPLNGFISEWLIFLGLFDAAASGGTVSWAALCGAIFLGITGALALACFVKVCGVVFLGAGRTEAAGRASECGWIMRVPMLFLVAACLAIGLLPAVFYGPLLRIAQVWNAGFACPLNHPPLKILGMFDIVLVLTALSAGAGLWIMVHKAGLRRSLTWDCGYSRPSPRMQYTAGSFAGIITSWFSWILCTEKHSTLKPKTFPSEAVHSEHTPETVLEKWLAPLISGIILTASAIRRLQHGRVQAYIFYLLIGLIFVTALALSGGGR